ncbi:hypothetical protein F2Q70_00021220 [Brassica cretica]|uniref:Uncharacterized protein n=1 Tax=Brassica cretica TaxID=69181 RepID=A0A8S9HH48_BRACR|nr:hypothetical protein F2Q70_00021220 [Brassica cretica]KAF2555532.1 hypothetical protein F2Q68_00014685 [Brassica cretica]
MGDDAGRRESRSMEETKDLRPRRSDVRTERRHDHKESYTDIKRRTSHETESKSLLLKKKKKKKKKKMVKETNFLCVFLV